ncbi:TPA: hypothetical protein OT027_005220, partial [Klebsiella quasipneumoniae]|nr:hypothetical protein [Klebsiella quasipneumoniae]
MYPSLFTPKYDADVTGQIADLLNAMKQKETNEQISRVIGSLAGAVVTKSSSGTYSGADAAQMVYRYNFDEHLIEPMVAAVAADY